jgi:hypothetical protein
MTRSPISLATEQLRTRLGVVKGVIGPDEKAQSDTDEFKEARRLVNEISRVLDEASDREMTTEQANAVTAKMTASEILILGRLPIAYLLSGLRDSCMEILILTNHAIREYPTEERAFATETLKGLNSPNTLSEETVRRAYLQARQRLDTLLASRFMLVQTAHRFMSNLWVRTTAAVLICSIPVLIFVYQWWQITYAEPSQIGSPSALSSELPSASPVSTAPQATMDSTEKGLAADQNAAPDQPTDERKQPERPAMGESERKQLLIPIARVATLFSVVIMGIVGAFVSNYSRVCALLKQAAPLGMSAADRSIRVRFSPFIGGLLAFTLSEVFGAHLVQGDLFPMTEQMHRWTDMIWNGPAYSKLLVWGFVAGLSENYVLRTLGSLATRVGFVGKSQVSGQSEE